ncbi:MAG: HAD family phosphatase [Chlamydiae bacterium]|nr:HAD family phosphatase [Chlamydiota bacterium]
MIQTMYFDLGNVLIFFSHEKMYRQLSDLSGLSQKTIRSWLLENDTQYRYETGNLSTEELYSYFAAGSQKSFSLPEFTNAASDIFTPNEELFPIARALKNQQIRLILLSNTSECHFNYAFERYPILKEFDDWVLSYKAGACKPSPLIFEKALTIANCPSENCFFVDDVPEFVEAARKAGLDSEVFSGVETFKKHLGDRGLVL